MKILSIYPNVAPTGCGGCQQGKDTPNCQRVLDQATVAPQLSGPSDEIKRLMAALGARLGLTTDHDLPAGTGWLKALHVQPGEVSLQLALDRRCSGAVLADAAFQTLCSLLPDTDIYVTHAA